MAGWLNKLRGSESGGNAMRFPKPPMGALTYTNWYFGHSLSSVELEIDVNNDPGPTSNLYLQLYDASIDGTGQYFGIQTTGRIIFSRFSNRFEHQVRAGKGSYVESYDDEGDFVTLRHDYLSLPVGRYRTRTLRAEQEGDGDWFEYYVTRPESAEELIGAIWFPRSRAEVPATFADGGGTWTEYWPNNNNVKLLPVPVWHVAVRVTSEGNEPKAAVATYSPMPNSDIESHGPGKPVHLKLGGSTKRVHESGKLWNLD